MVVKTGVSLPDDLYERLQKLAKSMGYTSTSRAIRDAVELFIAFNSWWNHRGRLRGVIVTAAEKQRLQALNDVIASSPIVTSVYVDLSAEPQKPVLVYLHVAGEAYELKQLYKKLTRTRGIVMVQPVFIPD